MKAFSRFTSGVVFVSLFCVQVGLADPVPSPQPVGPATFDVNPVSLRQRLLESNLTVQETLLSVKDAKDQVGIARGNLLPSLNLGALITSAAHSFFLSSIQFLLPFLIPSNWFNYNAQKDSFEAEKLSYLIMELNIYSSALSLYYTVKSDLEVAKIYQDNADGLNKIVQISGGQILSGTALPSDVLQTKVQADTAGTQALQLKQLADSEIATLRHMLALPLSTKITLGNVDLAPTPWETMEIQTAVDQANAIAPEHKQIQFEVNAAKNRSYSAKFGWITSATLGNTSATGNASFSHLSGEANFGFSFALGPQISIANRNIEEVQLNETNLVQTNTEVLETAITSFKDLKGQLDLSIDGETKAKQIYDLTIQQFSFGTGRFVDLLVAYTQITASSINRARAQEGVTLQRVVLDRMSLSDEFANIKGCALDSAPKYKKNVSLDAQCRQKAN